MALSALVFRAGPAQGFPPGAPPQPQRTWHGALHYPVAGIAFGSLVLACLVLASRFATQGRRGWAGSSRVAGVVLLVGFAGLSAAAGASWSVVGLIVALVVVFAWTSAVALHWYRRAGAETNRCDGSATSRR